MSNSNPGTIQSSNSPQISSYSNDIKTLQEKLPAILDDFKKYYVFFNKNPTYSEYQTIYANLKSNMNSISNELSKIYDNVNSDSKKLSDALVNINALIENEKNRNARLMSYLSDINNKYSGSKIMIHDYSLKYNENYIKNILLFFGIIISITALVKIFGGKSNMKNIHNMNTNLPIAK